MELQQRKLLIQVFKSPEQHSKALTAFKESYEGLQIGEFSDEILSDIMENGLSNIETQFKTTASEQLNKSGITSLLLKQNLLKGCTEVLEQFKTTLDGLMDSAIAFNNKETFDRITKRRLTTD